MLYSRNLFLGFVLLFFSVCVSNAQETQKRNPCNLPIVNTVVEYQQQIKENPDMELVNLADVIDGLVLDIRYATTNNFTGEVIYNSPKAYARKPVAKALQLIQDSLKTLHLGLKIYDAYRPYAATLKFYEVYHDPNFVASPKTGSRHNRGCAIDLSLIDLRTGKDLFMPTSFDDFTEKAYSNCADLPEEAIKNRTLLQNIMEHFGFTHIKTEWWHFDYNDWRKYPLTDLSFDELAETRKVVVKSVK